MGFEDWNDHFKQVYPWVECNQPAYGDPLTMEIIETLPDCTMDVFDGLIWATGRYRMKTLINLVRTLAPEFLPNLVIGTKAASFLPEANPDRIRFWKTIYREFKEATKGTSYAGYIPDLKMYLECEALLGNTGWNYRRDGEWWSSPKAIQRYAEGLKYLSERIGPIMVRSPQVLEPERYGYGRALGWYSLLKEASGKNVIWQNPYWAYRVSHMPEEKSKELQYQARSILGYKDAISLYPRNNVDTMMTPAELVSSGRLQNSIEDERSEFVTLYTGSSQHKQIISQFKELLLDEPPTESRNDQPPSTVIESADSVRVSEEVPTS